MKEELNLQQIQNETLKIMKIIHKICIEQNLHYTLFYGTLIGAVRHNGFIPWDDDLDIAMPRDDYERLSKYFIAHEKELAPLKWFSCKTVENYPYMIARICNTDFRMESENEKDCGMGPFVDIYPMDGAGNGKHNFFYKKAWFYSSMYFSKSRLHYVPVKGLLKTIVKRIAYFLSKIHRIESIRNKLEKFSMKFPYEKSEFVACMTWLDSGEKNVFKKEDIENVILSEFEDSEFYITKNYDALLKTYYGDYMQLPPEKERIGHHFYRIYRK